MSEPAVPLLRRKSTWLWLGLYLLVLLAILLGMLRMRSGVLATMNTPEAQAQWQEWRQADPNQRTDLPVKRRPPKSEEPPTLVLMRDFFPVMLGGALFFGSLLFAALAIAARGRVFT